MGLASMRRLIRVKGGVLFYLMHEVLACICSPPFWVHDDRLDNALLQVSRYILLLPVVEIDFT